MPHCALTKQVRGYIFLQLVARRPTMLETDVIDHIRHIFLHPRPHVSISQATALLGWTRRQMSEAIDAGDVELWTTPVGKWFPRTEMMATALEIWPLHGIEEAAGPEGEAARPQAIR